MILTSMRTLSHVKEHDRQRLLRLLDPVKVEAGRVILRAGVRVDHLYVVGEGLVATDDVDGTLLLHRPGEPVALRAMIDRERLPGDIVAVTDAEIWTMRRRDFLGACIDVPGFALGLLVGQARAAQTA